MADPDPRAVRVLVVDDSALMRKLLSDILSGSGRIEVVGVARDGREAVARVAELKPDVVTLDVEMPEVSGLDALPAILAVREVPVVMVSALTHHGADVTLKALELGAVDFHPKPAKGQFAEMRAEGELLTAKILDAARGRVQRPRRSSATAASASATTAAPSSPAPRTTIIAPPGEAAGCVAIGISTGGPQALARVLPLIEPPAPPILIVQHMPAQFTGVFAERLDRTCPLSIKEAEEGDLVEPNRVLIAPGGRHLMLAGRASRPRAVLSAPGEPAVSGHRPSADVLFRSVARTYGPAGVAVIMTGMGRDGADGCREVLNAGGVAVGQDEATSVVYGMNKAAFLEGSVQLQFALDDLPELIRALSVPRPR